jgi:hypothetical protein
MKYFSLMRRVALALFALLLAGGLSAQTDDGNEKPAKGQKNKQQFTCLYWEALPIEKLYYRVGEDFKAIKFENSIRSQDYALKGMTSFELYRDAKDPKENELPYELLARTAIPTNSPQILFLVIPFKNEDAISYRVVAMDDSLAAFPRGTFRFANFTSQSLLVKFAGEVQKIPASKMTEMSCKPGKGGGFRPFIIGNSKGKQIFGTRLFGQSSGRELVFISPPERKGSDTPRVKFISQLIGEPVVKPSQ